MKEKNNLRLLMAVGLGLVAFLVRLYWFDWQSGDYTIYLEPWFTQLKDNGGLAALKDPIGDYNVSYLFLMALLTYLPIQPLYSIKLLSCLADFVLAIYAARIGNRLGGKWTGLCLYAVFLFWPEFVLNSGAWAQCDAIYSAALVSCLYYLMAERPAKASVAFGVAVAFKLQAVFFGPVILLCLLKRKLKIRHLPLMVLPYVLFLIPPALAGRKILEMLTIYFKQTGTYSSSLSMNAPALLRILPDTLSEPIQKGIAYTAILVCGVLVLATLWWAFRKWSVISDHELLLFSAFILFLVPYLLPYMHERYFYPAMCMILLCAAFSGMMRGVAVIEGICMYYMYGMYLFGYAWDKLWVTQIFAAIYGVLLLVILYILFSWQKKILKVGRSNP